jgi:hypothetical protein
LPISQFQNPSPNFNFLQIRLNHIYPVHPHSVFLASSKDIMRTFLLLVITCLVSILSSAQDSTVIYRTASGKVTNDKDSAATYIVFTKDGKQWYGRNYYVKNNVLQSQGSYADMDILKPVGTFDNYSDSGILISTNVYDRHSEAKSITWYHRSGKKQSYIEFKRNGTIEQAGWDEQGNVIPGYIVQQEARFEGGLVEWRRYVERNVDRLVPENIGAKPGIYTVVVQFRIDKEGKITEVKAENIPPGCEPCAAEAVRVIQSGPNWQPAIQNNKPVIYRQRQSVTFVLEEETKKGRNR